MKKNKKQKKDVAFLCQFFYPEYVSSATLSYDLALGLTRKGYSVGALVGYPKEYNDKGKVPKREVHEGIDIKRVKYLQPKRTGFIGRLVNFLSFFTSIFFNLRFLKQYEVVVVYSNPPIAPLAAAIAKKLYKNRLIFVSFDVYPEIAIQSASMSENGFMAKVFRRINKKIFKRADRVVAVCSDMKEFLLENRNVDADKIVDIPNWYTDSASVVDHSENRASDEPFTLSYFGNLGTCQDETSIVSAIRALQDDDTVKFVFAGHGNKMDKIKALKEEEGWKNVEIHGFLQGEAFEKVQRESDCFIVTLIDGLYGLCAPSKAYSYFMCGKPIVCVMDERTEIAKDITDNGAGVVCKVGEGQAIVDYVRYLKNNPEDYSRASASARKIFEEKYEKQVCIDKFEKVIAELQLENNI